jgi:hypothetical protein
MFVPDEEFGAIFKSYDRSSFRKETQASEDYRILDVTDRNIDIPGQDCWIFDELTVVLFNFNPDGTLINRQFEDPAGWGEYLHWRDVTLPEVVPFGEYRA